MLVFISALILQFCRFGYDKRSPCRSSWWLLYYLESWRALVISYAFMRLNFCYGAKWRWIIWGAASMLRQVAILLNPAPSHRFGIADIPMEENGAANYGHWSVRRHRRNCCDIRICMYNMTDILLSCAKSWAAAWLITRSQNGWWIMSLCRNALSKT